MTVDLKLTSQELAVPAPDDLKASSGVLNAIEGVVIVLFVFLGLGDTVDSIPVLVDFGSERVVPSGLSEIVGAD